MTRALSPEDLRLVAHTIRGLTMDAVQKAKSGHPGMPMGMADAAAVLFLHHLRHCPSDPVWPNRDRFILSAGHGSMLLYSLLHLSGYDLPLSELQAFRQMGSRTPGHPEYGLTPGVETTTGPLGQGCANAVGMALAEAMLRARFGSSEFSPVDHHTYVLCSDGDLMEGLSHEAFSLAGHLRLHKLIVLYDCNGISIEGPTSLAYSDDVRRRFQAYHWNVWEIDAHDYDQIHRALRRARRERQRPTLILCRSHIAYGSPHKQDTAAAHGEPLGEEEVRLTKRALGIPEDPPFFVPTRVTELFWERRTKLERDVLRWKKRFERWAQAYPADAERWKQHAELALPPDLEARLPAFDPTRPVATRAAGGAVLQAVARALPWLVGGSADLAPSTRTLLDGERSVEPGRYEGRNLHFGVREHAMGAILNGMALHGGFRVYGSTFLVFADYFRPSIRLAALMKLPVLYVFTHDSFYVGEDGPTHQPVEQLSHLRAMPNMTVLRPADATETAAAWAVTLSHREGPTALVLTRQNVPVLDRRTYPPASLVARGAYTLWQSGAGLPDLILLATGSEVHLALEAGRDLAALGCIRVVSMPSWELFERQNQAWKSEVLPPQCRRRLALEAGVANGWERYVGDEGALIALRRYGASAPYAALAERFGFTRSHVVAQGRQLLERPAGCA